MSEIQWDYLNPFSYSWLTWLGVAIWFLPAVFLNWPFEPPWHLSTAGTYRFGFPFQFAEWVQQPDRTIAQSYSTHAWLADLLLIFMNQVSVLFLLHAFFRQFSIRTMLVLVSLSALSICALQVAFENLPYSKIQTTLTIIYFSPIMLALPIVLYRVFGSLAKRPDLEVSPTELA